MLSLLGTTDGSLTPRDVVGGCTGLPNKAARSMLGDTNEVNTNYFCDDADGTNIKGINENSVCVGLAQNTGGANH